MNPSVGLGAKPQSSPIAKHPQNENQEAKHPLIPLTPLITAAKRKMGFGDEIPKRVWAAAQIVPPPEKNVVSEQNATHSAIETGFPPKTSFAENL